MSRKTAREVAMKLCFSKLLGGEDTYELVLEKSSILGKPSEEDKKFADEILLGVEGKTGELDEIISKNAIGWKIDRLPKVDLCILRIALYEMLYIKNIPVKVSINEAVELAKTFSNEKSAAYINGILGTVAAGLGK